MQKCSVRGVRVENHLARSAGGRGGAISHRTASQNDFYPGVFCLSHRRCPLLRVSFARWAMPSQRISVGAEEVGAASGCSSAITGAGRPTERCFDLVDGGVEPARYEGERNLAVVPPPDWAKI
jgi:hypothetical protein